MVSDGQRSADTGPPGALRRAADWPGLLRFALPALMIVLVLAGLRGVASVPGWRGRFHPDGLIIGAALEVLLLILLAVLGVRGRHAAARARRATVSGPPAAAGGLPEPGPFVAAQLRTVLRYLVVAGLIAVPVTVLLNAHLRIRSRPRPVRIRVGRLPTPKHHKVRPQHYHPGSHFPVADLAYLLLILVLVAAVIVCAVIIARRKTGHRVSGPPPRFEDEEEDLRAAVASGQSALRRLDDARAAIIACYRAMEASLASAGAARKLAETPDELLDRAAAAGLVRGAAAARLTALFYEARFSSHPLSREQRDAAQQALDDIAASLPRPRAAAGTAGGA